MLNNYVSYIRGSREDRGPRPPPIPLPVKSQSYTPKVHKATKPAFNAGPLNGVSLAGRRWPDFVVFGSSLPSSTKTALEYLLKPLSESKLSGSASAKNERERERERESRREREREIERERERERESNSTGLRTNELTT